MVVDSVRPDHTSAYGYERSTTPNLAAYFDAQGARFETAVSAAAWTCPSNAALMTGQMASNLGGDWYNLRSTVPGRVRTLAEYLRNAGYLTAGFVNNTCLQGRFGFDQGFAYYDEELLTREGINYLNKAYAAEMNQRVIDWLEGQYLPERDADQPLFLFIYYMDVHVRLSPPPPYDALYDPDYTGPLTAEVYDRGQSVAIGEFPLTDADYNHLIAMYDGGITYWDSQFGALMSYFEQRGLFQDAAVIVTADHGEMHGEHGRWVHGSGLYQELIRVPLFMRYPGAVPGGAVYRDPVQSMDAMATILEWAGIRPVEALQARSLAPLLRGEPYDPQRPVFSEIYGLNDAEHWAGWYAPGDDMLSVQVGEWKLIHYPKDPSRDELYRLNPDSLYEVENLIASQPEIYRRLLELLPGGLGEW
jgi:arylsulfatase A-like enzyme